MSALFNNRADVEQLKIIFMFLSDVPYVDTANLPPCNDECYTCLEPFNMAPWHLGGTLNRPIKLPCGHIVGIQCLTRWVLSDYFDNECSLCRVKIIEMSHVSKTDQILNCAFMTLEILAAFEGSISSARKERLLDILKKGEWGPKEEKQSARKGRLLDIFKRRDRDPKKEQREELLDADRRMMLFEEMMGYLSKGQSAQQRTIVLPVMAARPVMDGLRYRDFLTDVAFGVILAFETALLWDLCKGRDPLIKGLWTVLSVIYGMLYATMIAGDAPWPFITFMGCLATVGLWVSGLHSSGIPGFE